MLGCEQEEQVDPKNMQYYDLRGFIENQIVYLTEKRPQITKSAVLNNKQEVVKTQDIDWKKELELFMQADINKPSFRNSYQITAKTAGIYEYKLKADNDLPVRYLKILTDTSRNQPVFVKAIIRSKNRIYESEREIELTCSIKDNLTHLTGYRIKGYQQLILTDPKTFLISTKIGL